MRTQADPWLKIGILYCLSYWVLKTVVGWIVMYDRQNYSLIVFLFDMCVEFLEAEREGGYDKQSVKQWEHRVRNYINLATVWFSCPYHRCITSGIDKSIQINHHQRYSVLSMALWHLDYRQKADVCTIWRKSSTKRAIWKWIVSLKHILYGVKRSVSHNRRH